MKDGDAYNANMSIRLPAGAGTPEEIDWFR